VEVEVEEVDLLYGPNLSECVVISAHSVLRNRLLCWERFCLMNGARG
jgi:hypothetical protein